MLAVQPPIAPMLARLTRELPTGSLTYEPKWDGFRCLAWVDGDRIDLRSRHDRPLARYFPEVAQGLLAALVATDGAVLDGELVIQDDAPTAGSPSAPAFERLMRRLHPAASLVARLSRETPARYVAFDVLAIGARDLRGAPFVERRAALERLLHGIPADRVVVTTATRDPAIAERWLEGSLGPGSDGVVATPDDLRYDAGRRTMIKVKRLRTADCVVVGARPLADGSLSSLLLGLYDDADRLRHVGVVTQMGRRTGACSPTSSLRCASRSKSIRGGTASRSDGARSGVSRGPRRAGRRTWTTTGSRFGPSGSSRSASTRSTTAGSVIPPD
jgi:ATP-dependent DNA ligase